MAMPDAPATAADSSTDRERHPRAVQDARQHVASEIVGAEPMRRRWRFAAVGEVELIGRVRRERRRGERRRDQAHEQQRRRPHYATTRGSISACATSATTLNTTIAVDVSIRSAIRTV